MADESLAAAGLYIDELNKIRVLEPEVAQETAELKDECKEFVDSKAYLILHIYKLLYVCQNLLITSFSTHSKIYE